MTSRLKERCLHPLLPSRQLPLNTRAAISVVFPKFKIDLVVRTTRRGKHQRTGWLHLTAKQCSVTGRLQSAPSTPPSLCSLLEVDLTSKPSTGPITARKALPGAWPLLRVCEDPAAPSGQTVAERGYPQLNCHKISPTISQESVHYIAAANLSVTQLCPGLVTGY